MRYFYSLTRNQVHRISELKKESATGFEIRLDCFPGPPVPRRIRVLTKQPLLATFRSKAHLGQGDTELRDDAGWQWRLRCLESGFEYIDIELDEPQLKDRIAQVQDLGGKVVLSHHELQAGASLDQALDSALATNADIVKIIGMGKTAADFQTQRKLYNQAGSRPLVCFFMGSEHLGTRVLSLTYGAPFTFLTLQPEKALAPGQLTARDVYQTYKPHEIPAGGLRLFAVIGNPVGHSRSPDFHNPRLNVQDPGNLFIPLPCDRESDLTQLFATFPELKGLAVTKPMKEIAFQRAQGFLDPDSEQLGAVNTLVFEGDRLMGANTDLLAMLEIFRELGDKGQIRLLGYGGLGKAVVRACSSLGLRAEVCNRTPGRIGDLPRGIVEIPWQNRHDEGPVMLVQATSAGMAPQVEVNPMERIPRSVKYLIETIYNPLETQLAHMAKQAGIRIFDGLELFNRQARIQNRVFLAVK